MHLVTGKTAIGNSLLAVLCRRSTQSSEGIEALELQAAVVAQQLMQACHLENNRRIVVATLKARAFASGTPHIFPEVFKSLLEL
jgi:hypothetical protein